VVGTQQRNPLRIVSVLRGISGAISETSSNDAAPLVEAVHTCVRAVLGEASVPTPQLMAIRRGCREALSTLDRVDLTYNSEGIGGEHPPAHVRGLNQNQGNPSPPGPSVGCSSRLNACAQIDREGCFSLLSRGLNLAKSD